MRTWPCVSFLRLEIERGRIDAIANAALVWRAIGKDMPQMATAFVAQHFGANHAVRNIAPFLDRFTLRGAREGGPAAAAVVFGIAFEQQLTAPGAAIATGFEMLVILASEGALGPRLAPHMRSEERRVGKECVRTFTCRLEPVH